MRVFLKNISGQLKQFSKSLDKKSILIDQPWALIDDEFEMQKLIFKKNGELIMSKNGNVTTGSWEYLAAANSLLIDLVEDKILCKEEYIDDTVMILKLDGTDNRFFALANENELPDLNVFDYLQNLRKITLRLSYKELNSGQVLEITNCFSAYTTPVYIDGETPKDGDYVTKKTNERIVVKNGMIDQSYKSKSYTTKSGLLIYIDQQYSESYNVGEYVYKDPDRVNVLEDGVYKLGLFKKIKVVDGQIIR